MRNQVKQRTLAAAMAALVVSHARAESWQDHAIAPVTNPIYFESPAIQSEIRPIFAWHRLDSGLLGTPVDVRLYALQLRYALTDRESGVVGKDDIFKDRFTVDLSWRF